MLTKNRRRKHKHTHSGGERDGKRGKKAEREGESGIDTAVLLFVSDGSGKDFRCRSQNGKKPTVIRRQDKEQGTLRRGGRGGQASIGRGRKAARGMPTGQGNNALGLPEPRGMRDVSRRWERGATVRYT